MAKNDGYRIWINGELVAEHEATVSVFDSGFVLGDGVWEGVRVAGGRPAFLDAHLDRLTEGAKALFMAEMPERSELVGSVQQVIDGNGLVDDAHLRIMLTRGVRRGSERREEKVRGMPRIGVGKPGLHRLPSLRTGRAVFPHPALRSVFNSVMEVGARVPGLF